MCSCHDHPRAPAPRRQRGGGAGGRRAGGRRAGGAVCLPVRHGGGQRIRESVEGDEVVWDGRRRVALRRRRGLRSEHEGLHRRPPVVAHGGARGGRGGGGLLGLGARLAHRLHHGLLVVLVPPDFHVVVPGARPRVHVIALVRLVHPLPPVCVSARPPHRPRRNAGPHQSKCAACSRARATPLEHDPPLRLRGAPVPRRGVQHLCEARRVVQRIEPEPEEVVLHRKLLHLPHRRAPRSELGAGRSGGRCPTAVRSAPRALPPESSAHAAP